MNTIRQMKNKAKANEASTIIEISSIESAPPNFL
jgi:hypothetical protein